MWAIRKAKVREKLLKPPYQFPFWGQLLQSVLPFNPRKVFRIAQTRPVYLYYKIVSNKLLILFKILPPFTSRGTTCGDSFQHFR